jgi:hypothetical protein
MVFVAADIEDDDDEDDEDDEKNDAEDDAAAGNADGEANLRLRSSMF